MADVTIGGPDQGKLQALAERTLTELERAGADPPAVVLADAGYWNGPQIGALRERGIDALVAPDRQNGRGSPARRPQAPLAAELRKRLDTDEGRALYRKRQRIIEPIFGQTKANRGFDRFLCRGLGACRAEWSLITATHNLLKAWRYALAAAAV
jgi:Transposase DDE domain